jgi:hypothetical protein
VSGDGGGLNADSMQCPVEQPAHGKERDRTAQHGLVSADELGTWQVEMCSYVIDNWIEALLDSGEDQGHAPTALAE